MRMNNIDHIILKTIFETKSLSKAAALLYMTQPAISYRIRNIEKELDSKIILKTPRGIQFTPQGLYIVNYIDNAIFQLNQLKSKLANWNTLISGSLKIGCSTTFAYYDLPPILKSFRTLYPDISINLKTGLSSQINEMLKKNLIDIAILRENSTWTDTRFLLKEDPLCLVNKKEIVIERLPAYPRITYKTDPILANDLSLWWNENFSCPSSIAISVDRMAMCRRMVSQGLGWSILPLSGLNEFNHLFIKKLNWKNHSPFAESTWVNYKTPKDLPLNIKIFIDYLHNISISSTL
jgi:DNA-binding transcriptional LysR family regulator